MCSDSKSWMIHTAMTIDFGSKENVDIFIKSYQPESGSIPAKRSKIRIKSNDTQVIFEISGLDVNAMRATLNSILNFTNVVKNTIDFVENNDKTLKQ